MRVSPDGLTRPQLDALRAAFLPFANDFARVDLFGSRARGDHRAGSDIDLIVEGLDDDGAFAGLLAAIDDSDISVRVDVLRYRDLTGGAMEVTLRRDALPLFSREDLLAG